MATVAELQKTVKGLVMPIPAVFDGGGNDSRDGVGENRMTHLQVENKFVTPRPGSARRSKTKSFAAWQTAGK
jgi:hypothetical protein